MRTRGQPPPQDLHNPEFVTSFILTVVVSNSSRAQQKMLSKAADHVSSSGTLLMRTERPAKILTAVRWAVAREGKGEVRLLMTYPSACLDAGKTLDVGVAPLA